jgi:hypothetical protein
VQAKWWIVGPRRHCNQPILTSNDIPDNILVDHKALANLADLGALITYTLDRSLSDGLTRVADLADIRIVKVIVNYGRGAAGGELSR